ncbi:hypothetical protein [Stieleria mannarensis]|uniref:hypothetical protein n=1 Tax=Stieleria mannarensis TaxID=2755585 RepID=UPI00256FB10D|nr:hypothetical protein [Rhodopirellula sp. JC639]
MAAALISASLAALTGISAIGCHRQYYRKQADQEVHCLLQEKTSHVARRPNTDLSIQVDRRSRMYNPFDLDFQPMPMDDPASHRYMQCVDGRRGYPMWDAAGFTNSVENPDWWQFLPLNEDGVLVLNADTAVQIALLHSTEYQQQLETLYLSALDVSSERFQFDTQFFGGTGAGFDLGGDDTAGGDNSDLSLGTTGLNFSRAFAHGGSLVAGVANNIVWELSGNNTQNATSLMSFELFQPLLRQAGRDKVMTRLTLAERSLLANIRSFERFRRGFYLNVTVGRNIDANVRRSGGVFGVGLSGFTGLGSGLVGGGFSGGGGGAGVQDAGGFMGLLQDQLQIRNLEENIARLSEDQLVLENTLIELLTTIPEDPQEIVSQRLQVAQQKSALLSRQSELVARKAAYQASLDRFKSTLGLPPYICARIEDPMLERFELIDRDLRSRREQLTQLRSIVGDLNLALLGETEAGTDPDTGLPISSLSWTPAVQETVARLQAELQPLDAFLNELLVEDAPMVETDIAKLAETIPQRIQQNDQLLELYKTERESICTLLQVDSIDESVFDVSELSTLQSTLGESFESLIERLQSYRSQFATINASLNQFVSDGPQDATPIELSKQIREELILATQDLLAELGDDVLTMQLIQARARTESALLPEVNIQPAEAFEIARRNRRDWANARAALVDSWRAIEFIADDLESSLDIRVSGGVGTLGGENNPFALRGKSSTLSVGLEWDAPITRLQERNTYRQSLIEFEQAKRGYYEYEDSIWQLLRAQIRQLQVNRVTFEYGRQSVRIAAAQIELNTDLRELRDARGLSSGPTAARDTISALEDLLNAQNSLLNIFVNYEVIRRGLDLDLGTMELTPEGLWIDPGPIDPEYLLTLPGTTVEAVPGGDCSRCGIRIKNQPQPPDFRGVYIQDPELLEINQVGFEEAP